MSALVPTVQERLRECESRIEAAAVELQSTMRVELRTIHADRLYHAGGYSTFEAYCQGRWNLSRSRAYQLLDWDRVVENVSTTVDTLPNERQARELVGLDDAEQRNIWQQAVESAPETGLTTSHVKATRELLLSEPPPEKSRRPRDPLDRYYTPDFAIPPLLDVLGDRLIGHRVWEPCAGGGAIVDALRPHCDVVATDLDPDAAGADRVGVDFLTEPLPEGVTWIVTNFPYAGLDNFLARALSHAVRVAALCRLSVLEGTKDRVPLHQAHNLSDLIVLPRFCFEGPAGAALGNNDQVPPVWMVWDENPPHFHTKHHYYPDIKEPK